MLPNPSRHLYFYFTWLCIAAQNQEIAPSPASPSYIDDLNVVPMLLPTTITPLVTEFTHMKKEGIEQPPHASQIVLYGKAGSGKTTLAKHFAHETKSKFIEISMQSLIEEHQKQGESSIDTLFSPLHQELSILDSSLVILVKQADYLLNLHDSPSLNNVRTKVQQALDKITALGHVRIFLATTELSKSTFLQNRIVQMPNLDETQRKKHLHHMFIQQRLQRLSPNLLNQYTHVLRHKIPTFKNHAHHFAAIETSVNILNKALSSYSDEPITTQELSTLQKAVSLLKKQHALLLKKTKKDLSSAEQETRDLMSRYSYIVQAYIERMNDHVNNPCHQTLTSTQLDLLAQATQGHSIRSTMALIASLHNQIGSDKSQIITDDILNNQITLFKKTDTELKQECMEKNDRKLQEKLESQIKFRTSFRQYNSSPSYGTTLNSPMSLSMAGITLSDTTHIQEDKQNPTIHESHALAAASHDNVNKTASALIQKQDGPRPVDEKERARMERLDKLSNELLPTKTQITMMALFPPLRCLQLC